MTVAFKCSKPFAILKKKMQTIAVYVVMAGEDEKVLHRCSNVNAIVSAGGKNFLPKRSTT